MQDCSEKYLASTKILNNWLAGKQKGKHIVQYFEDREIHTIAIYGMSFLGQRLFDELENSSIKVKFAIDKNAKDSFGKVKIFTPDEQLEGIDAIVVTATYYFEEIAELMREKVNCRIISLEDIVNSL